MGHTNFVHVDCDLLAYTDRAVKILAGGSAHWIPFSQLAPGEHAKAITLLDDADEGEAVPDVTLSMSEWIAEQKGIEPE